MARWWRNERGEWYVVAQAAIMGAVAIAPWFQRGEWPAAASMGGIAMIVLGVSLGAAGFASLGRNLTPLPRPKDDAVLVERGAYALVRHPIYSGISLASFGWGLAWESGAALALAALLLAFFDLKSRREERWLVEAFPAYEGYRRRVKKLIPFVY